MICKTIFITVYCAFIRVIVTIDRDVGEKRLALDWQQRLSDQLLAGLLARLAAEAATADIVRDLYEPLLVADPGVPESGTSSGRWLWIGRVSPSSARGR
jgi:hypothetical protein